MHELDATCSEKTSTSETFYSILPSSSPSSSSSSSLELFQNYTSSLLWSSGSWLEFMFEPQWHVFCLFLLVVAGVVGNSLVCVAVCVEKKLQNVTNYFLVSLAIADLLVSLIVMPCCIVQEFVGYWPMGVVLCNTWLVADVTLCTSSIMHMCTISMDRYLGVKFPFKMRNRSKFIVGVKVVLVWIFSLTLASPLVFIGMNNSVEILNSEGQCGIFNPYFLVYGSMVAFFVPFLIMLVTYTLTIRLLRKRAEMLKWGEASMVRSAGRKKKRSNSINRSKSNWVSSSTTESSTEAENMNTIRFHDTNSMLLLSRGNSLVKNPCHLPEERCVADVQVRRVNGIPSLLVTSKAEGVGRSSDSEGSLSEESRSYKKRTKRSLRRILMEPMIRKKLKSRCATHSPSTPRRFKNSDVFVKCSPNHRTRSLKPRETMLRSKTRSFQEIDDKGVNVLKLHQHDTRNSAPSSCTNLASNFSRALPSYFKSGKDKNQIKYEVFTTSHQLKNLLRPTLSLDASCIRYEVYRSSDESDPIECDSRKNRGSIEDRYRKRSGIPLELSIERNLTHFGNSSACISSDKNISSADSSSLHSFIEKFLVSRETGKHGQMNSVKTEKKAVKVLGAMFCFFFLCWSSFFVMNTFIGMCRNCRFSSTLFKCFLWLGYSSSIVNPIIYTIFNKAFKQTFQSLLTCSSRCLLTNPYKANYNRGRRRCWDSSNKKGVDVTFYNRRSTTTTTTTSSSYCRRMSSRKSIAVSEECLDKHHVRATP